MWREEYNKIISIIHQKCIYDEDKENLNKYTECVEKLIELSTPVLFLEMLDNYNFEADMPGRLTGGNSTYSCLESLKGQIYRNACMLIARLFNEDEYEFPDMNEYKY